MAQKRMFDKTITNSDEFIEMPISCQVLYFHLSMNADDDGFVNNWKSIMRMIGTKEDDLKVLIAKQFIIPFESGVIVIKHWRINNFLRKDRHNDTKFQKELSMLGINESQEYVWLTSGQPSIDKNRLDKNSIDNNNMSDFEIEFEKLWKLYPKKVGKKDALKHYIKSRKNKTTYEDVLNGIKKYNDYISKSNTPIKYVKDGSSWFNQESWNDERILERKENNIPEWFDEDLGRGGFDDDGEDF